MAPHPSGSHRRVKPTEALGRRLRTGPCPHANASPERAASWAPGTTRDPRRRKAGEARLLEVPIEGERLVDAEFPHHGEARAVREAPSFVRMAVEEVQGARSERDRSRRGSRSTSVGSHAQAARPTPHASPCVPASPPRRRRSPSSRWTHGGPEPSRRASAGPLPRSCPRGSPEPPKPPCRRRPSLAPVEGVVASLGRVRVLTPMLRDGECLERRVVGVDLVADRHPADRPTDRLLDGRLSRSGVRGEESILRLGHLGLYNLHCHVSCFRIVHLDSR